MGRYDGKASGGLCGAEASQKKQFVPPMGRYDGKASGGLCDGKWCWFGGFWNCGKHIICHGNGKAGTSHAAHLQ